MLTSEMLGRIMERCPADKLDEYTSALNKVIPMVGLDTVTRAAAFLGQIALESGQLRWWKEFPRQDDPHFLRYEQRHLQNILGNINPGDGEKYCGHGPMQITGRNNHTKCSAWIASHPGFEHVDLVNDPELLVRDAVVGFMGAAWYWIDRNLNELADKASLESYKAITKAINGGYNGHDERVAHYIDALQILGTYAKYS